MKYSNSFTHDLKFGELAESWVNDLFNGGLKIEVKSDRLALKTGNIFIEVYSREKKSGISITDADYWIYRFEQNDIAIIIPTNKLKELVKEYFTGSFTLGGDNNTSKGVLIPINKILQKH